MTMYKNTFFTQRTTTIIVIVIIIVTTSFIIIISTKDFDIKKRKGHSCIYCFALEGVCPMLVENLG